MLKLKHYILRYRELLTYGIFGGLTTLINIVMYLILTHGLNLNYMVSNAFAWIVAFVFAYYTNSKFVFNFEPLFSAGCLQRFFKFFNSRIFTGMLDMFLMWFFVGKLTTNDSISKFLVNVIVIILNYVMSKYLIFKGEK